MCGVYGVSGMCGVCVYHDACVGVWCAWDGVCMWYVSCVWCVHVCGVSVWCDVVGMSGVCVCSMW